MSFGMIPLSPDDKPDGFVLLSMYEKLESENAKLRELVRDYHRFADAMCAERDCDGCSQRDEGACERGVLTSRECVLGVDE